MQNEASIQPLQSPVTEMEANFYSSGLPSRPRLIARSSTTPWEQPIGPWAYSERKELRIVGDHPVVTIWAPEGRDGLSLQVMEILNSKRVQWTALDVIRIAKVGEPSAPVIVWIGILPQSLSPPNGLDVALECKQVLVRNSITDVDVEIRETLVSRSAGPSFLDPICTPYPFAHSYIYHPFAEVRRPLTTTFGLSICAQATRNVEGTGGFFIAEGGGENRIMLVTARHVVVPDTSKNDVIHEVSSGPREDILLLGDAAFETLVDSTETAHRYGQEDGSNGAIPQGDRDRGDG
ncbi:hypothetical protein PM082_017100 [Marasmius tenuissimus]|nr:hypothetical protein PM082_017100 [Marasmius tenuissimus]